MSDLLKRVVNYNKEFGMKKAFFHTIELMGYKVANAVIMSTIKIVGKNKPLKDIIVIQSHNDFDCNGGALYEYLIENGYNKKYKIVWLLRHEVPKELPYNVEAYLNIDEKPNIKKMKRIYYAKYLFADDSYTKKLREDQKTIFCNHSAIGLKDVSDYMNHSEYKEDYVLSPSKNYDDTLISQMHLDKHSKLIYVGFPFQDVFFKDIPDEYKKLTDKNYNKRVLWMPTFRKHRQDKSCIDGRNDSVAELPLGLPLLENLDMCSELNDYLNDRDILLTIKFHPAQDPETYSCLKNYSNILVIDPDTERKIGLDKYALMKYTDALISDYSGAAYEYLILDRPLAFVTSDMDDYSIGFNVDNIFDYMPGNIIGDYNEFLEFFNDISNGNDRYKKERKELKEYFYKYTDGNCCKRLLDYLGIYK